VLKKCKESIEETAQIISEVKFSTHLRKNLRPTKPKLTFLLDEVQ
jgi:hypothetical protein